MTRSFWKANRVIAIILFLFSLAYICMAFEIPEFTLKTPIDSDLFPKVLGIMMLILAVLLYFEKEKNDSEIEEEEEDSTAVSIVEKWSAPKMQVGVITLMLFLYIIFFETIGFIVSTLLFLYLATFYFGYKKHVINVLVSILFTVSLYLILHVGLGIHLPKGLLPF